MVEAPSASATVSACCGRAVWLGLIAVASPSPGRRRAGVGFDPTRPGSDAWNYLAAGERLNAGHPLYALSAGRPTVPLAPPYWSVPLLAPPPIAVLWRPLALLGDASMVLWATRRARRHARHRRLAARRGGLVAAGDRRPVRRAPRDPVARRECERVPVPGPRARLGLAGPTAARRRRCVAVAIAVKLTPVLLVIWLATARRWRAVGDGRRGAGGDRRPVAARRRDLQNHLDWLAVAPGHRACADVDRRDSPACRRGVILAWPRSPSSPRRRCGGDERLTFTRRGRSRPRLASPALYLGTLGIAAAAAAPWVGEGRSVVASLRGRARPDGTDMTTAPLDPAAVPAGQAQPTQTRPAGRAAGIDRERIVRIVALVLSGLLVLAIVGEVVEILTNLNRLAFPIDGDRVLYMDATRSWLNGTGFYHDYQLAGPYDVRSGDILYPPPMLLVFAPLAVIPEPLSAALYYAIPLGITLARRPLAAAVGRRLARDPVLPLVADDDRRHRRRQPRDLDHGVHGPRDAVAARLGPGVPEADARARSRSSAPTAARGGSRSAPSGSSRCCSCRCGSTTWPRSATPTAAAGSSTRSVRRRCCSCRSRPGRRRRGGSRRGRRRSRRRCRHPRRPEPLAAGSGPRARAGSRPRAARARGTR